MNDSKRHKELAVIAKTYAAAIESSRKYAERRLLLGTDCTRAAMTTANANWERAIDDREHKKRAFVSCLENFKDLL